MFSKVLRKQANRATGYVIYPGTTTAPACCYIKIYSFKTQRFRGTALLLRGTRYGTLPGRWHAVLLEDAAGSL